MKTIIGPHKYSLRGGGVGPWCHAKFSVSDNLKRDFYSRIYLDSRLDILETDNTAKSWNIHKDVMSCIGHKLEETPNKKHLYGHLSPSFILQVTPGEVRIYALLTWQKIRSNIWSAGWDIKIHKSKGWIFLDGLHMILKSSLSGNLKRDFLRAIVEFVLLFI